MAAPTTTLRVDWWARDPADFTPAICTVHPLDQGFSITRGRSADFSGDATGALSFVLDNTDYSYTEDRQWHDNGGFIVDTTGWSTAAVNGLTAAATSLTRGTADKVFTASGSAVLTSTSNSGVTYAIPYRFRSGVTYGFSVRLKSSAGTLSVRAGLASAGTPADIASTSGTAITTSWATYSGTWTPSADRTDVVFFVRTTAAATATVLIDGVQVNPGSAANTYLEAPSKGQLQPGRPVHAMATYSGTDYPLFFGFLERITPSPDARTVSFECYDPFGAMQSTDGFVPAVSALSRCGRDYRIAALEDYARGSYNLIANPEFATNTTGWGAVLGATISRITTDGALNSSSCLSVVTTGSGQGASDASLLTPQLYAGQTYRFSAYLKSVSGNTAMTLAVGSTTQAVTITSSWARYSMTYTVATTIGSSTATTLSVTAGGTATFYVDAVAFTRGQGLYPYPGSGRPANYVANGGFDSSTTGWAGGWYNLCRNGSFETDLTGWANGTAVNGSTEQLPTTISRSTTNPQDGTYSLLIHTNIDAPSAHRTIANYSFSQTFLSGVSYYLRVYVTNPGSSNGSIQFGVAADYGTVTSIGTAGWKTLTWTPSADRTGVKLSFILQGNSGSAYDWYIDAITVVQGFDPGTYIDTGTFGTASPATISTTTSSPKYGYRSAALTIARANDAAGYDFYLTKPAFLSGQSYTASAWVKSSSGTATVEFGLGFGSSSANDKATSSTSVGTAWTQVTTTWTPSVDRLANTQYNAYVYVKQTDASARTLYLDGVRVEPGTAASAFELTQWSGLSASDAEVTTALPATMTSSGTILGALGDVNAALFSRHWISATTSSPWWKYSSVARDTVPSIAETITDAEVFTSLQSDRAAYVTAVPVSYLSGGTAATYIGASDTAYALVDQDIVGSAVGSQWTPTLAEAQSIAAEVLARYGSGHKRPQVGRHNDWPAMFARDLNDLVVIQVTGWLWPYFLGSVERLELSVTGSGQDWVVLYVLDEWTKATA